MMKTAISTKQKTPARTPDIMAARIAGFPKSPPLFGLFGSSGTGVVPSEGSLILVLGGNSSKTKTNFQIAPEKVINPQINC